MKLNNQYYLMKSLNIALGLMKLGNKPFKKKDI